MKPIETVRSGLVKGSIFPRQAEGPNGAFTSYSVALQSSYQNKETGEFVNRKISLIEKDLQNVANVCLGALEYIKAAREAEAVEQVA